MLADGWSWDAREAGVAAGIPPTFGGSGTSAAVQGRVILAHPMTSLGIIGGA